jgi:hypothetical protein
MNPDIDFEMKAMQDTLRDAINKASTSSTPRASRRP